MGIKNWNVGFQQCILGDGCFNEFSIQNECLSKGVPELVNNVDMQRTHDVHWGWLNLTCNSVGWVPLGSVISKF